MRQGIHRSVDDTSRQIVKNVLLVMCAHTKTLLRPVVHFIYINNFRWKLKKKKTYTYLYRSLVNQTSERSLETQFTVGRIVFDVYYVYENHRYAECVVCI